MLSLMKQELTWVSPASSAKWLESVQSRLNYNKILFYPRDDGLKLMSL